MFSRSISAFAVFAALHAASAAHAADYTFDVLYFGNNNATLAAGSDDPTATTLVDGDAFDWTIAAEDGYRWTVAVGGDFFPLMAFAVDETGRRTGDFSLTLSLQGAPVFTLVDDVFQQAKVHVGTDTVTLDSGLSFDHMALSYSLIEATEHPEDAVDPDNLQPIGTTPTGLLPIFGAPEMNTFYPGVVYAPIPEPATTALLLAGLATVTGAARRRARG